MDSEDELLGEVVPDCWQYQRKDKSLYLMQRRLDEGRQGEQMFNHLFSDFEMGEGQHLPNILNITHQGNETIVISDWLGLPLSKHLTSPSSPLACLKALMCGLKGIVELRFKGLVHGCIQPSSLLMDINGKAILAGFWPNSDEISEISLYQDQNTQGEFAGDVYALGKVAAWIRVKEVSLGTPSKYFQNKLVEFEETACRPDPAERDIQRLWMILKDAIQREMIEDEYFRSTHAPNYAQLLLMLLQYYERPEESAGSFPQPSIAIYFLKSGSIYQSEHLYEWADYCYNCCILTSNFIEDKDIAKKVRDTAEGNMNEMRSRVESGLAT